MSDLFKDMMDKAKETLNPIVDKAKEMVESGELKDKASDALADVKEKAAPVLDKVMDAAGDVADKVKGVAGEVLTGEKSATDVKNELFAELGAQVAENKDAIQAQAAQMEEKIQEMLGGKEQ